MGFLRLNAMTSRDTLLLVDLQNAFFNEAGLAERQTEIVDVANRLIDAAHAAEIPIFVITTEHSRDESTWTLGMLEAGEGFLFHGDEGTQVVPGLNTTNTTQVEKTRDSAFFGTDLHMRFMNLNVGRIVLAGVSTHGCVAQTTRDAYAFNLRTTIVTDAVADTRDDYHHAQIKQLEEDGQAALSTVDDVIAGWQHASW